MEKLRELMKEMKECFIRSLKFAFILLIVTIFPCLIYSILPSSWQETIKVSADKILTYLNMILNQDTMRAAWKIILSFFIGLVTFSILWRLSVDLTRQITGKLKSIQKMGVRIVVATVFAIEVAFSGWVAYIFATSLMISSITGKIAQLMVR